MVIPLIYSYHITDKMATQEANNTDVKGIFNVSYVAREFLVGLYTVTKGESSQVRKSLFLRDQVNTLQDMPVTMHINYIKHYVIIL